MGVEFMRGYDGDPDASHSNRKFAMLAVKCAAVLVAAAALSLVFRPAKDLIGRPISEDGYYALTVARNIAGGRGVTIDGHTLTNGFQPLFTFMTVPAYWIAHGRRLDALRYVLLLQWLFYLGTAWLLGMVARDGIKDRSPALAHEAFWWTAFLYLASTWIFMASFNGLETGCLMFFYAAAWRYYQLGRHESWSGLFIFGFLLGLTVLTRVDAVFLVIIISATILLRERSRPLPERLGRSVVVAGTAFLVSLPWWVYNILRFGSLMPTSGTSEEGLLFSWGRVWRAGSSLLQVAVPYIYWGKLEFEGTAAVVVRFLLLAAGLFLLWKKREVFSKPSRPDEWLTARTVGFAGIILLTSLLLLGWYTLTFKSTWFYVRYVAPLTAVSTVMFGYAIAGNLGKARSVVPFLLAIPVCLVVYAFAERKVANEYFEKQVGLVREYVPDSATVGAPQSGTLGYCRDGVVNLDGKVNPAALAHMADMPAYLRSQHIEWLCDWKSTLIPDVLGKDPGDAGWSLVASKGPVVLYHYTGIRSPSPQPAKR